MSSMTMSRSTVTADSFVSSVRVRQFGIVVNYFQARNARRRTGGKTRGGGREGRGRSERERNGVSARKPDKETRLIRGNKINRAYVADGFDKRGKILTTCARS